jgi:hypothetical protein
MTSAVDLKSAGSSLGRQAEGLRELRLRCAQLRDARERSHAQLDAAAAAIDERIDECLRIGELVAVGGRSEQWRDIVTELERHLRRLCVLRSRVLALYLAPSDARGRS